MTTECLPRDRTINYIEFAVADIARSKAFYGKAFGWCFTDMVQIIASFRMAT